MKTLDRQISLRTMAGMRALLRDLSTDVCDKVFFDSSLPGYGLRVRESGVHSLMIQYAIAGRTRRVVFGPLSRLDPGKTYAVARDLLARARLGHDPAAEKDQAKAAAAETFGALLPRFLERQMARLKPRSYVETERHLKMYAKALHGSPIEAITKRTIAARLAEIEKRSGGVTRNRVRSSLSAYFTWLAREGYLDANPVTFTNKADENGGRERGLSDEEIRTIWLSADDGPPNQFSAILQLLILTGARRTQDGSLAYSELDLDAALITLPPARTKNGREHLVPLSEPALGILKALPRRTMDDGAPWEHVFGARAGRGYQNYSRAKAELDGRIAKA